MEKYILGIETSCDDTSVSIVRNGKEILSNEISSQIAVHNLYGGVVPEIASRKHIECISQIVDLAIKNSKIDKEDIDAISVTNGPGLIGSLLVGISFAKGFAYSLNKPLIPINHIEAHICANYIENNNLKPPFLSLVVSGGHSSLLLVKDYCKVEVISNTHDDAVGECFDKVGRVLGLDYPAGPIIDKLSKLGNKDSINFPHAKIKNDKYGFSFSGVKSAVLNYINKNKDYNKYDLLASFQKSVIDVLVENTIKASLEYNINDIAIAGGVASNSYLRKKLGEEAKKNNLKFYKPSPILCTDNGAMVAACGYLYYKNKNFSCLDIDVNL